MHTPQGGQASSICRGPIPLFPFSLKTTYALYSCACERTKLSLLQLTCALQKRKSHGPRKSPQVQRATSRLVLVVHKKRSPHSFPPTFPPAVTMMIHQYAPREAQASEPEKVVVVSAKPVVTSDKTTPAATPAASTTAPSTPVANLAARRQRMSRPASMRTLVGRSTSDSTHFVPPSRIDTTMSTSTTVHGSSVTLLSTPSSLRGKRMRRFKSYSESGALLERLVPPVRTRPFSAGDAEDMRRRVTISGVSKNNKGTWMFKVDVGSDECDTYVIRRRFTDFKALYDGLQDYEEWGVLPPLPHHGLYSVFQLFVSPEKALNQRADRLQALLQSISTHPVLSAAVAFQNFIGKNPQSLELGYVSLSCYEAPTSENQLRLSASESSYVYDRQQSD